MGYSDNEFSKNMNWVSRVIDSCENQRQVETSEKLVNNFTNLLLKTSDDNYKKYTEAERVLREKLIEKKLNVCKQ